MGVLGINLPIYTQHAESPYRRQKIDAFPDGRRRMIEAGHGGEANGTINPSARDERMYRTNGQHFYDSGKRRAGRKLLSGFLALLFVLTMLPATAIADALDQPTYCGQEEHTHTDECYGPVLTCGMEEGEGAHTHTDACYTETTRLICELEEGDEHTHTEECYETVRELVCGLEESEGHVHTEACYEIGLICEPVSKRVIQDILDACRPCHNIYRLCVS